MSTQAASIPCRCFRLNWVRKNSSNVSFFLSPPNHNGSRLFRLLSAHLQAIAFTAGFHFAFIEQAGTGLHHTLTQKVSSLEVLRILVSIGGSEIMHFQTWQNKAGNALPLTDVDPITAATVTFEDLTQGQPETLHHLTALAVAAQLRSGISNAPPSIR